MNDFSFNINMATPDGSSSLTAADVDSLVTENQTWIDDVLQKLEWDEGCLLKGEELAACPVDSAHAVPISSLQTHLKYCPLLQQGYTRSELDEEQSSKPFYTKSKKVMTIELSDETVRGIISRFSSGGGGDGAPTRELPQTQLRAASSLTSEEHVAVHEYCIEAVKAANKHASFPEEELQLLEDEGEDQSEPRSRLELLAAERDMKRRRQAYRGKSVHTGNKSYTEVIGEVIAKQVELLTRKSQRQLEVEEKETRRERSTCYESRETSRKKRRRRDKSRSRSPGRDRSSSPDKERHRKHKKHKKKHRRERDADDRKSSAVKEVKTEVEDDSLRD